MECSVQTILLNPRDVYIINYSNPALFPLSLFCILGIWWHSVGRIHFPITWLLRPQAQVQAPQHPTEPTVALLLSKSRALPHTISSLILYTAKTWRCCVSSKQPAVSYTHPFAYVVSSARRETEVNTNSASRQLITTTASALRKRTEVHKESGGCGAAQRARQDGWMFVTMGDICSNHIFCHRPLACILLPYSGLW